jgi:hypothetical protein
MNMLYFDQIKSFNYSPLPVPQCLINQQLSVCFAMTSSYTDKMYFNIIHSVSFLFSLLPLPSSLKQFQFHYYRQDKMYIIYIYMYIWCIYT